MPIGSERIRVTAVTKNVKECRGINTLYFEDEECAEAVPGQFVMVWAPGYDEMPMSLSSYSRKGACSVTVKPWEAGTNFLVGSKRGTVIGVRGPYGRGFSTDRCNALLVGGGTGLAPLMPLAEALKKGGSKITIVLGGRTRDDLLFVKRARRAAKADNVVVTTDDGSQGLKGFPTDIAESLVSKRGINRIYACGPEVMMRKLYDIAVRADAEFEASLEREMKCGMGICGSCTVGQYLLCRDGPVLGREQLGEVLDEFGLLQRDRAGNYIKVQG